MIFLKKQSTGFYLTLLSAVLAGVGAAFYFVNCSTAYFSGMGVNAVVAACAIAAILAELGLILGSQFLGGNKLLDLLAVAPAVLLMVALVLFIGDRVAGIASILTFENNAQTMADLSSALAGIVCLALATVAGITASFFHIVSVSK